MSIARSLMPNTPLAVCWRRSSTASTPAGSGVAASSARFLAESGLRYSNGLPSRPVAASAAASQVLPERGENRIT
jgi:hypothetical protein